MEIDIEEDENEPELTYPYEEMDPLNPPPPASESKPDDEIEDGDSLLPGLMRRDINSLFGRMTSISRRLCGRKMAHALVEKKGKAKDKFYGKLILKLGNEVRSSEEQGFDAMEKLVEKHGNTEEKVECKKLKKELEEARGYVFEERPNEAINVSIEDEKSHVSGREDLLLNCSSLDSIVSAPMPQAAISRMIKDIVDAAIAVERARQANVKNDASGSGLARGQDAAPAVCECTFTGFMKCNLVVFQGKKVKFVVAILEGPALTWWKTKVETIEPERVKVDAYIWGLTDNIKGEVTSSKPADLNEAVRMAHKLMEQKSQARDTRILEGKKRKWESLQGGNSSGKGNQRDKSRYTLQNSQKQGNARAMVGHKARYYKEKSVATGVNVQPIWTCYDCGQQGHTRNRCTKYVKQEEVREARGQAYAIKDAEPQGLNVVTGTFMLNNCYAFVLFDLGSDRSFVDSRFSAMLDIDPIKIGASYEVELANGRVASTNTVMKGCTLNLVNHIIKIDLMQIELGTFDVIIMDWLVKHDAVIICGEKVVRILYENEMLDKGRKCD
nr:hypothetical protein [Tanacetum cinerariifolium]GEZ25754.1 hypothetical protein [Tanacetum cinerariifolium]